MGSTAQRDACRAPIEQTQERRPSRTIAPVPCDRSTPAGEMDLIRNGDDAAFGRLIARFTPMLRSCISRYNVGYDDASDVIQTCWEHIYFARARLPLSPKLEAWLWRTCQNTCIDYFRRIDRERVYISAKCGESTLVDRECEVESDCDDRDSERAVEWLAWEIQRLPDLQREVAVHRWMLDQSTAQTAEELGIAAGTVKAALFQCRRALRRRLLCQAETESFIATFVARG